MKAKSGDAAELDRTLREAAAWCRLRADPARPAESLRTPELLDAPWPTNAFQGAACVKERLRLVGVAVLRRRAMLEAQGIPVLGTDPVPTDGFAILVWPDSGLGDERARELTGGFFDAAELPGQDTWLAYVPPERTVLKRGWDVNRYSRLIAWIPDVFRDRWEAAKRSSVFDGFTAFPAGTSASRILTAALAVASGS